MRKAILALIAAATTTADPLGDLDGVEPLLQKFAPPGFLDEYRLPTEEDIQGDWVTYLEGGWYDDKAVKTGHLPLVARGDFNGDGVGDLAVLMVSRTSDWDGLFCLLSDGAGSFEFQVLTDRVPGVEWHGIATVPPGTYETLAAGGCGDGPPEVTLEHDGIDFWKFEVNDTYFVWDAASGSFSRVWISGC